eukprot:TRINITY_DN8296_c0_g1_i1.p1 TRINITY_DN8296_c0_g1~~TRINITY_DN8296_c0_g1_i1.p1  ORF type:complete len:452 (+),score=54.41 TRINITY_DN8296_c0_g1_i1:259-1614(+)
MIIYNALPLVYQDIDQITQQLPTLKYMCVDIIWLNPIQSNRRMPGKIGGSLYSMTDEYTFLTHWRGGDIQSNEGALKWLVSEANRMGIILMFDLVMKQVGRRLPKVWQHPWLFKDANRGEFNCTYENAQEMFDIFFRPFIHRYVVDYGFKGMRIDAAGMVSPAIQKIAIDYFRDLCEEHHHFGGIVLGEFLADNQKIHYLKKHWIDYDLITNSSYWNIDSSPYFDQSKRGSHNPDMWERRQISRYGTIGWTGNHDLEPLYSFCSKNVLQDIPLTDKNRIIAKMMRERIALVAFLSDGGYYILCGDEYGSSQRRNCFEWEGFEGEPGLRPGQTIEQNWGGSFNMVHFIKCVNTVRNNLPKEIDKNFWSEQYLVTEALDPTHRVRCIVRNNATGFSGSMDIIFVNVYPNEEVEFVIDDRFLDNIKHQIKANHNTFDVFKHNINVHFVGSFKVC